MVNINSLRFPILKTERLTLRQLSIDDQNDIFALRSDPEVNRYLDRQPAQSTADAVNFINNVNKNVEKHVAFYWAITITETKKFVGTICLFDFSNEKDSCEIGYELMTRYQGQGIMKEAAQAVLDFAVHTLGVKEIRACTHYDNQHSSKLLTKLNFVKNNETDRENPDLHIFLLQNIIDNL